MFIQYNGNPCGTNTGDCVIRAISIATGMDRHKIYLGLCVLGYPCTIWGNSNALWSDYLAQLGFRRHTIYVNDDYTAADFAADHPNGNYILGTGRHAIAVIDGNIIDSWDSSGEIPRYYFTKE